MGIGAALAGFYLPLWLGFNATCMVAIVVSGAVALVAFRLSRGVVPMTIQPTESEDAPAEDAAEAPAEVAEEAPAEIAADAPAEVAEETKAG